MPFQLFNDSLDITVVCQQRTELMYTRFYYYDDTGDGDYPGLPLAQAWVTQNIDNLKNCLADNCTVREVRWVKRNQGIDTSGVISINEAGTVVGDALPSFNTWSFKRVPDNTQIDPPGAAPFKTGKFSFSGIPEDYQNDGVATATAITVLGVLVSTLPTLVHDGRTWREYYVRRETTSPYAVVAGVPVAYPFYNRIGSQLTRKQR